MTDFQNRIVGVVGRKGSGKSTRVSTLLRYCPRFLVTSAMQFVRTDFAGNKKGQGRTVEATGS
jgi:ABC-type glutathione transport system ATPase component